MGEKGMSVRFRKSRDGNLVQGTLKPQGNATDNECGLTRVVKLHYKQN